MKEYDLKREQEYFKHKYFQDIKKNLMSSIAQNIKKCHIKFTDIEQAHGNVFIEALHNLDDECFELLVQKEQDVFLQNGNIHILQWAIENNLTSKGLILIKLVTNVNIRIPDSSILILAIQKNMEELVPVLIEKGIEIDTLSKEGKTALALSIENEQSETAKLLIANRANVNIGVPGSSILILAIQKNMVELVPVLIEKGIEIDTLSKEGKTALALSIENEQSETAKLLIANRANVNIGVPGSSILILAVCSNRVEIVRSLIRRKVDLYYVDNKNHNAIYYANLPECNAEIRVFILTYHRYLLASRN